jgi:hypothetical protein
MKRSPNLSTAQCLVRFPGTLSRARRIEGDERIETGVVSFDMREMRVEYFDGRYPPPAYSFGEIVGGREERTRGRGGRLASSGVVVSAVRPRADTKSLRFMPRPPVPRTRVRSTVWQIGILSHDGNAARIAVVSRPSAIRTVRCRI